MSYLHLFLPLLALYSLEDQQHYTKTYLRATSHKVAMASLMPGHAKTSGRSNGGKNLHFATNILS